MKTTPLQASNVGTEALASWSDAAYPRVCSRSQNSPQNHTVRHRTHVQAPSHLLHSVSSFNPLNQSSVGRSFRGVKPTSPSSFLCQVKRSECGSKLAKVRFSSLIIVADIFSDYRCLTKLAPCQRSRQSTFRTLTGSGRRPPPTSTSRIFRQG